MSVPPKHFEGYSASRVENNRVQQVKFEPLAHGPQVWIEHAFDIADKRVLRLVEESFKGRVALPCRISAGDGNQG